MPPPTRSAAGGLRTRRRSARPAWEIAIVGGGPAGLSTWLHLHALEPDLARRTLLIEREVYPRYKPCGGAITALGTDILAGLGVVLDVPSLAINEIIFQFGSERLRLRRDDAMRVVCRSEFDHALARVAMQRGLLIHQGEGFRGFRRTRDGLAIETTRDTYSVRALVACRRRPKCRPAPDARCERPPARTSPRSCDGAEPP